LPPIPLDPYLKEFDACRSEIQNRTTLSYNLIALELGVLGVGVPVGLKNIDLLGGLGLISSLLWLLWLDHTEQIYKLAAYIGTDLRSALVRRCPDALGWEGFLRRLDQGGAVRPTNSISTYVWLLYSTVSPILNAVYAVRASYERSSLDGLMVFRFALCLFSLGVWVFAVTQYRAFTASRRQIDRLISEHQLQGAPLG